MPEYDASSRLWRLKPAALTDSQTLCAKHLSGNRSENREQQLAVSACFHHLFISSVSGYSFLSGGFNSGRGRLPEFTWKADQPEPVPGPTVRGCIGVDDPGFSLVAPV